MNWHNEKFGAPSSAHLAEDLFFPPALSLPEETQPRRCWSGMAVRDLLLPAGPQRSTTVPRVQSAHPQIPNRQIQELEGDLNA